MRALISIGTNSTRLLIADRSGASWVPVRQVRRGTRLGEGLGPTGQLRPGAIARTLDAVVAFSHLARSAGAEMRAISTSAMRRAANAGEMIGALESSIGVRLHVISGQEEARYSFMGALAGHGNGIAPRARVGVLDAGGGSTELAVGTTAGFERARSFEIGAVRLSESTPLREDPPPLPEALTVARERAHAAFEGISEIGAGIERLICVGGTATTAAAILSNGEREGERVDGARLSRLQLTALAEFLAPLTVEQRKTTPALPAQRADIIVGGLIVLEQAFIGLGLTTAITSVYDLLLGYVIAGWK